MLSSSSSFLLQRLIDLFTNVKQPVLIAIHTTKRGDLFRPVDGAPMSKRWEIHHGPWLDYCPWALACVICFHLPGTLASNSHTEFKLIQKLAEELCSSRQQRPLGAISERKMRALNFIHIRILCTISAKFHNPSYDSTFTYMDFAFLRDMRYQINQLCYARYGRYQNRRTLSLKWAASACITIKCILLVALAIIVCDIIVLFVCSGHLLMIPLLPLHWRPTAPHHHQGGVETEIEHKHAKTDHQVQICRRHNKKNEAKRQARVFWRKPNLTRTIKIKIHCS